MLWSIFAILLIMWAVGVVTGYTLSNFIHVLFIGALVILVVQLFSKRRTDA